jgi:hypothetical protein
MREYCSTNVLYEKMQFDFVVLKGNPSNVDMERADPLRPSPYPLRGPAAGTSGGHLPFASLQVGCPPNPGWIWGGSSKGWAFTYGEAGQTGWSRETWR